MKNGSSLRYLTNIILYLIIIFASLDILNHFLSPGKATLIQAAIKSQQAHSSRPNPER